MRIGREPLLATRERESVELHEKEGRDRERGSGAFAKRMNPFSCLPGVASIVGEGEGGGGERD